MHDERVLLPVALGLLVEDGKLVVAVAEEAGKE